MKNKDRGRGRGGLIERGLITEGGGLFERGGLNRGFTVLGRIMNWMFLFGISIH